MYGNDVKGQEREKKKRNLQTGFVLIKSRKVGGSDDLENRISKFLAINSFIFLFYFYETCNINPRNITKHTYFRCTSIKYGLRLSQVF